MSHKQTQLVLLALFVTIALIGGLIAIVPCILAVVHYNDDANKLTAVSQIFFTSSKAIVPAGVLPSLVIAYQVWKGDPKPGGSE